VTVEVSLEAEASAADREAVVRVFESADIQADVRADYIRRSADLLPWLIVIGVVAARFLWTALGGAGDEAGRDAWRGLKSLVTGLYEARRSSESPQGGVSIRDSETSVEIQLPPGLPDQAYIRIIQIEFPNAPLSGILRWDDNAQDWTDVFAGQYRCFYPGCSADATQSRVRNPAPGAMESRLLCDLHAAAADIGDPKVWT
jgi:hypothetical protein